VKHTLLTQIYIIVSIFIRAEGPYRPKGIGSPFLAFCDYADIGTPLPFIGKNYCVPAREFIYLLQWMVVKSADNETRSKVVPFWKALPSQTIQDIFITRTNLG